MDLLEKFEAVTVQADHRISPVDKDYCERHQNAYEAAITSFQELSFFWNDMRKAQEDLLKPLNPDRTDFSEYLYSEHSPKLSEQDLSRHVDNLHETFIQNLVYYFNRTYHVSVESHEVKKALLPAKPDRCRGNEEEFEAYYEQLQALRVRYEDVVEQVILRLDGRTFAEQALFELKQKCHKAAWYSNQDGPKFERKKAMIYFGSYMCRFRDSYYSDRWELQDPMKDILRGLAHYETGLYAVYPLGFGDLLGYGGTSENVQEFPSCHRVKSLKMFKSGRVDLKFASDSDAETFVNDYLGAVC